MPHALALAPLTLAAVLVVSGLAKRPDPQSTRSMMTLLRLPSVIANGTVARLLPWGELAVAALLLTPWRWTYAVGAAAALLLFTAFLVIIGRAMTFDPRPSCGCFGRVGDHRVNGKTLGRNVLLVALAAVSGWIALEGRSATGLVSDFTRGDWLWLLFALVLAAVALLILMPPSHRLSARQQRRQEKEAARRAEERSTTAAHAETERERELARAAALAGPQDEDDGLEYERVAIPRGVLLDRAHEARDLRTLPREQAQLLVLVNCWCGPTMESIDRLAGWQERLPELGVQLVHTMKPWDEPRLAQPATGVWWDPGSQVYDALEAGASPAAVLLGMDGELAGGPVNGVEEIEQFVADIEEQLAAGRAALAELEAQQASAPQA